MLFFKPSQSIVQQFTGLNLFITTLALAIAALTFIPCSEAISGPIRRRSLDLVIALAIGLGLVFSVVFTVRPLRILYDLVPLSASQYALAIGIGCIGAVLLVALTIAMRANNNRRI